MSQHVLTFAHKGTDRLPICSVCTQVVNAESWAAGAECPGPPMCDGPAVHMFLDGRDICVCRLMDLRDLRELS